MYFSVAQEIRAINKCNRCILVALPAEYRDIARVFAAGISALANSALSESQKILCIYFKYADDTIAISGFFFFLLIVTPPYFLRMYILILKPAKVNRV